MNAIYEKCKEMSPLVTGLLLGAGVGLALNNLAIGIAIGLVFGAALQVRRQSSGESKNE